ncbi:CPBP family intramembrane metalloprotease [bacterium]|nr:CPBP family intramembrane metalloprotease [bacterium]
MSREIRWPILAATLAMASALWFLTFYFSWGNFWLKISLAAGFLGATAILLGRGRLNWEFRPSDILIGIAGAAVLYLIFWIGNALSGWLFGFAPEQVNGIYSRGEGTDRWVICLLLLLVTSPGEEIYWRGFLQENLGRNLGKPAGYLVATACYALVHLPAWNFMLIGAAAVAGLFWGLLYWKIGRIVPLIICHAVWSVTIFALLPIG